MSETERTPLIAGNWKMNGSAAMAEALVDAIAAGRSDSAAEVLVIPPFPYIDRLSRRAAKGGLQLGAQDLSVHASGAFTGEVSGPMLVDVGAGYVLVGHSERRDS
ncbi:MAG: triose-phosphate isomerase, partial [Wenzhouxiangellaceae bacterium]|nr:triose-phosphate isomerase [Wenzhouxiangellaceae bacterium]